MFKRLVISLVCLTFSFSNLQLSQAGDFSINQLPVPGTILGESMPFVPAALKGLIVDPKNPLELQFIVDTGHGPKETVSVKQQAKQLVKYFLAGLTIPEGDLWVNLSPYEKNRMVPVALGQTDLGRDLLAQDYILKQLTASLIYPEQDLGKQFWSRVYRKAQQQLGTTNIPVNTFNKVWILPNQAQVFENGNAAYVTKSTLKVMLDEDYLARQKHQSIQASSVSSQVVRAIILPEIEKEVNQGKNFGPLRQIYQALILAKWYKETIQNGLLDAVYTNKNKVAGVNLNDPNIKEKIYQRYIEAYKKGAFNYIKEEPTPDGQITTRRYFSGGINRLEPQHVDTDGAMSAIKSDGAMVALKVDLQKDSAMKSVEFDHGTINAVVNAAVQELQKFLQFINDPESDSGYLQGRSTDATKELIKRHPYLIAAAQEFLTNPEKYSREALVLNGQQMIPKESIRIEEDVTLDGSIRQILLRGIPDPFRSIAQGHIQQALGNDLFINTVGRTTLEIKAQNINKSDAVVFLENNFDAILDEMGYEKGVIDARQTRTVIATDGDGTLWAEPNIGDVRTFSNSPTYGPVIEYLKMGGILQIVTGNLFKRSLERIEGEGGIPLELRRRIIVSTSGGTAFYVYDKDGHLKEFPDYEINVMHQANEPLSHPLDILYIGDDERKSGNDHVVFQKVGFGRSILVTGKTLSQIPDELRRSYVGGNQYGTKTVLEAIVRIVERHKGQTSAVFTDDAVDTIKNDIIQHSFRKIENNIALAGRPAGEIVERALETLSVENNVIFIQGDQHEGERQAKEVVQRLALNGINTKTYQIDLNELNFRDISMPDRVMEIIRKIIPPQGRVVILIKGIEKYAVNFNGLGELTNDPHIILVGVTNFEGYRSLEMRKNEAKDLHFIMTEPDRVPAEKEKRIAVIGASGFLGEKMFNVFEGKVRNKEDVLGTGFSKATQFIPLDVTDEDSIRDFFSKNKVDVVVYAAGEADADKTKKDMPRAMALNTDVVSLIKKYFEGKFVYISTEYVFDGQDSTAPYTSTSPTKPVNEYGFTKVEGEKLSSQMFDDAIILRIGVLYGYNHPGDKLHFAKDVLEKLKKGQDFVADDKQLKRPVLTDDVALTAWKLIQHNAQGIFQVNGFEPMTKYQEALAIAQVYYQMFPDAKRVVISPTYAEYAAPRPLNTFMINSDTPRLFDRGVREMILSAQENEDISPLRNEETVVASNKTDARDVKLDPGEKRVFDAIQKDVLAGTLTPDNLTAFNRIHGEVKPYENVESLPEAGSEQYRDLVSEGETVKDAVGFSMGGLSTRSGGRMRLGFRFVLKEVDPRAHSMIEWKLGNVRDFNDHHPQDSKPVVIMTSNATVDIYNDIRKISDDFGLRDSGLFNFDNALQWRIAWDPHDPSFGKVARQHNGDMITNPSGHYAFIKQMVVSGVLAQLKRKGIEFIYHSNMNNFGALIDDEYNAAKGLFWERINEAKKAGREIPMTLMEVVDNDNTKIGAYPALVNGKPSVIRAEMMPQGVGIDQFKYFSTGNFSFYIDAILTKLGLSENYDHQLSKDEIAAKFDEVFNVQPIVSRKVFYDLEPTGETLPIVTLQVERNIDDFVAQAPAVIVRVSPNRFIPVKTEDELKKERKRLATVLQGNVDVRYEQYRVKEISKTDKQKAVTSFIRFRDYIRDQVWGGHWILRLKGLKWKDETIASESVEMSSYPEFPSIMILESGQRIEVTDVNYFGFAQDFFGRRVIEKYGAQIPFILKFLDAQKELSIQVHPTDEQAQHLEGDPDAKGKEEIFFVVDAEENNDFVLGLKKGVTQEEFTQAVQNQDPQIEGMLNHITVRPGDVYRVPSGTPHAFQHGIQAIEIGQMSDLTYRLYDYNRQKRYPTKYGNRDIHVNAGLASVNFDLLQGADLIRSLKKNWKTVEVLPHGAGEVQTVDISPDIHADRFVFQSVGENKGEMMEPVTITSNTQDRFHALMAVKGAVILKRVADGQTTVLKAGQTVFLPAKLGKYEIITMSPQPSLIYRFYPQFEDEYPKMNIGISIGGSKFIFGLVDKQGHVLVDNEFNWRKKLNGQQATAEKIETMIMDEIGRLLRRYSIYPQQIEQIGIAWPGPVNYDTQLVTATYLPFSKYALSNALERKFYQEYNHHLQAYAVLDVQADVLGEMKDENGGLKGKSDGLVLNLATGISMGILKNNQLIDEADYSPSNGNSLHIDTGLPQIGRHLIRPKNAPTEWEYHPTPDGSNPVFSDQYERFSRTSGGPFIAKRFVASLIEKFGSQDTTYFTNIPLSLGDIAASLENRENDSSAVDLEGQVLAELTRKAYTEGGFTEEFLSDAGLEIGSAIGVFIRSYPNIFNLQDKDLDMILVGSIGEKLGNPKLLNGGSKQREDIFLKAIQKGLQYKGVSRIKVKRSTVDRNGHRVREIIAFQTQEDFKVLLKDLDHEPTRENYHATFRKLTKASWGYLWMPILLTTQDALGHKKDYQITVPSQMVSDPKYRKYIVNYLALLLNIQGELRGLSSYSVKVWGSEDSQLVDDVDQRLKEDFPLTNERVNFGKPIVHGKVAEIKTPSGNEANVWAQQLVSQNDLGDKTGVVNALGDELGVSGFIQGKVLNGLLSAHVRENMSAYASESSAGLKGDFEDLVNERFILRRANVLGGVDKFKTIQDVNLYEKIAKKVYYELGENLVRFYQEFMKQYDLKRIDYILLTGPLATSKFANNILTGLKKKLKEFKIDVGEIKIVQGPGNQRKDEAQITLPGGIDFNQINIKRTGRTIDVHFDPQELHDLLQGGFEGFTPEITSMTYIQSPLPLLGIHQAKADESLARV